MADHSGNIGSSNGNGATPLPRHVAFIMDGNGRWARSRMMPRLEGHRAGAKTVRMIVEECRRLGIKFVTLFAFSSENWQRPAEEVSGLMKLFHRYLESELTLMLDNDIRLRAIGNRSRLPETVRQTLERVEEQTKDRTAMELILAISYGGREEIINATRQIAIDAAAGKIAPNELNDQLFSRYLYAPEVPDPDLLIRTSGENRISNFLLWQLAYTEIIVTPSLWPDFSREHFLECLAEFRSRDRRFGLTGEQLNGGKHPSSLVG